jgi:hypothetical protein
MNWLWKLATALAVLTAFYAVWDNGRRVLRLERQVCDTVTASIAQVETIAYYRDHPDEKAAALANNRETLRRFHCPIEKE